MTRRLFGIFVLFLALAVVSSPLDAKKQKKKPVRGSGFSVTLPTEPMAGAAKDKPIMAVLVQDEGVRIMEYEIKEGQSISFRVGGSVKAYMERVGPAPDGDMFMDAATDNADAVTVDYEHALAGPQTEDPSTRPTSHNGSCTLAGGGS